MIESKSFLMKRISEMNSPIPYFIIKMSLMNSDLLNRRKNKKRKPRKVLRLKRRNKLKCSNKWLEWILMVTNLNMVKTPQYLTRCTWIILNKSITTMFQMLAQLNLSHHKFLKDRTVNKAPNMVLMEVQIDKTMTMRVKAQV